MLRYLNKNLFDEEVMAIYELLIKRLSDGRLIDHRANTQNLIIDGVFQNERYLPDFFLFAVNNGLHISEELSLDMESGVYDRRIGYICFRFFHMRVNSSTATFSSFIDLFEKSVEYSFHANGNGENPLAEIRFWYDLSE